MGQKTEQEQKIASGIRLLDKNYFDYLYGLKDLFEKDETPSILRFISEVTVNERMTVVFTNVKGVSLRSDIRRQVAELYDQNS